MKLTKLLSVLAVTLSFSVGQASAQGLMLSSGGAMHSSMAGASTAYGVDSISALFWNPAAISGMSQSEVTLGGILIIPHNGVTSTLPAGALGAIFGPATTQSGRTNSDNGLVPATSIGLVYQSEANPRLSYGLLMSTVAVGGTNYPGDANNP